MKQMVPTGKKYAAFASLLLTIVTLTGVLLKSGCGSYAGNPEEESEDENLQLVQLPDVRSINLSDLGKKTSLSLAEEIQPCTDTGLGIFGLPIGAACHTSFLANSVVYGNKGDSDGDGIMTCADYVPGADDNGILNPLLCERGILKTPRIKSLRFPSEKDGTVAFDFGDFDSADQIAGIGHWTAKGDDAGRYPANIRVWAGKPELNRLLSLKLIDGKSGDLMIDFSFDGYPGLLTSKFSAPASPGECANSPGPETCYHQEIRMKTYSDPNSIVPGTVLSVYADDRQNPSFVVIEGKISYTKEIAEKVFSIENNSPASFAKIREIYFRNVQKGGQIWGAMDFKDENGKTIQTPVLSDDGVIDLTKILRDGTSNQSYSGVCQNRGVDAWVECSSISYKDYDGIWRGDGTIVPVLPDFDVTTDFSNPPAADGVVQVP